MDRSYFFREMFDLNLLINAEILNEIVNGVAGILPQYRARLIHEITKIGHGA